MMSLIAVTTRTSTVRSTTCHHAMFLIQLLTRYMFTCSHLSTRSTYPQATGAWYSHSYTCNCQQGPHIPRLQGHGIVICIHVSILSTRSTYPQATGTWYSHLYTCKYTVNKVHTSPGYRGMFRRPKAN